MPARPRHLTVNAGKVPPSPLVMLLIARGVHYGCFTWPETFYTKQAKAFAAFLADLRAKGLTETGRTPSEPELQNLPVPEQRRLAATGLTA